jgi:hypothetical protein
MSMSRVKICSKRQSRLVRDYYSSTSALRTSTNTRAAQEAMEKYTVEKVRLPSCTFAYNARMLVTDKFTGDRPPHQAHGPSQRGQHFTAYTNTVQFDERKGATWHCIVGRNFGSFVTHGKRHLELTMRRLGCNNTDNHTETKHFIYFYLGHCAILLFKTQ